MLRRRKNKSLLKFQYHRDDNGSFIIKTLLRLRTCCMDEVTLTYKALTNHSPGLATSRHYRIKISE